jgi:hypothetical protein
LGATVGLKIAAESVDKKKPGPRCGMGVILAALEIEDLEYFEDMKREGRTGTYIADVFREDGYDVSEFMVRRHNAGRCSCR